MTWFVDLNARWAKWGEGVWSIWSCTSVLVQMLYQLYLWKKVVVVQEKMTRGAELMEKETSDRQIDCGTWDWGATKQEQEGVEERRVIAFVVVQHLDSHIFAHHSEGGNCVWECGKLHTLATLEWTGCDCVCEGEDAYCTTEWERNT